MWVIQPEINGDDAGNDRKRSKALHVWDGEKDDKLKVLSEMLWLIIWMWTKSSDDLDENIETRLVIAIDDDDDDKLRFSS